METNKTIGIETWGGGNRKQKTKPSKLDLVTEISSLTEVKSLDITALSISDLEIVLARAREQVKLHISLPTGRLKKPYISALEVLFPNLSLNKLPVAALRELLGAFNEK